jgi:hypothetical protein
MWPELQNMRVTYQQITQGERPWNALGDFLSYWFGYAPDRREELVKDPIQELEGAAPDLHQWAVFCAASVEYLCQHSGLPCPDWVTAPTYTLSEPWFMGLGAHKPQAQARLLQETPEPFSRRNIYCGNRVFANKYELAEHSRGLSPSTPSPLTSEPA